MATLRTQGLRKRFGHVEVLHGIDLDIADGEFVVLVGPSGCGKSTLLRMVAGLEEVSDGELWIGGARAEHLPPQKRDIAMVFQSYALFPHMTVRDNIAYGPRVRGESTEKVEEAAELLNLSPYLERYPRELSGGQRQRVAMGRALQRQPRLFLFDEPLSNLDAQLRVAMRAEIKALHERLGNTIVYVTHDQVEAMTMADRIVVMRDGRIEQQGAPLDIYDRPANIFVGGFIGSPAMSFLRGRIEAGTLRVGDLALPVAAADGRVDVGVRPDAFSIAEGDAGLEVEVQVTEPMGPETHVLANVVEPGLALDQATDTATDIRAVVRRRVSARSGDRLRLRIDPEGVHLFDPDTGERLNSALNAGAPILDELARH